MKTLSALLFSTVPLSAIELSRATLHKLHSKMWWALGCNEVASPLAAAVYGPRTPSPPIDESLAAGAFA